MADEHAFWDLSPSDEPSSSGAGTDAAWGDWDETATGLPDDVWDAFELDDPLEEPEPEYGDFWPEADEDEVGG